MVPNATYRLATTWGEANVAGRANVGRIAEDVDVGIMSMSNFEAFCWGLERGEGERTALDVWASARHSHRFMMSL